jgi:spore germination cell wall hydrolase CwlJ-like protein
MEGKQAIAVVLENRAQKDGKTIKQVAYEANQFSCLISTNPEYPLLKALADSIEAWHGDCKDVEKLLGDATFYRVTGAANAWFDQAVASGKLVEVATIGKHTFYKEV